MLSHGCLAVCVSRSFMDENSCKSYFFFLIQRFARPPHASGNSRYELVCAHRRAVDAARGPRAPSRCRPWRGTDARMGPAHQKRDRRTSSDFSEFFRIFQKNFQKIHFRKFSEELHPMPGRPFRDAAARPVCSCNRSAAAESSLKRCCIDICRRG